MKGSTVATSEDEAAGEDGEKDKRLNAVLRTRTPHRTHCRAQYVSSFSATATVSVTVIANLGSGTEPGCRLLCTFVMTSPRPRSPLPSAADIAAAPLAAAASVVSHLPSLSSLSSSLPTSVRSVRSSLTSALNEHAPGLSSTFQRLRKEAPTSLSSAFDSIRDESPSLSSALGHVMDGTVSSAVQGRLAKYKEKAGEVVARVQQAEDDTDKRRKERAKRKEEKAEKAARKHRMLKDSTADDDSGRSSKRTSQPPSDDELLHASDSMDIASPALSASSAASSAASVSAPSTPALSATTASLPASSPPSPSHPPESPPSPTIDPTVWPSFEPSALLADLTALLSSVPSASVMASPQPSLLSLPPSEPFAGAAEMLRAYDEMCANVAAQRTELADVWAGMQGGLATAENEAEWLQAELERLESDRAAMAVR